MWSNEKSDQRRTIFKIVCGLLLVFITTSAIAQKRSKTYRLKIYPTQSYKEFTAHGYLLQIKDSSIIIDQDEVYVAAIHEIVIRKEVKTRRGLIVGALSGAAVGVALGFASGNDPHNCSTNCAWVGGPCVTICDPLALSAKSKAKILGPIFSLFGGIAGALPSGKIKIPIFRQQFHYNKQKESLAKYLKK